jgi:uncharacterized protein YkuJ
MKKRWIAICIAAACLVSLTACGETATQDQEDSREITTSEVVSDTTDSSEAEEDAATTYTSTLGYTVDYDAAAFTVEEESDTSTTFTMEDDDLEAPVYVAVQYFDDMSAEIVINGVALQSGQDIEPETASFGKDGIDALTVHYSEQGNTVMQTIAFYAVPLTDETCLLVEAGGYEGEETIISDQLSAILDSFALTTTEADAAEITTYTSTFGYTVDYDAAAFTVEEDTNVNRFVKNGDDLEAPVYVAVQYFDDMSAEIAINGVALQSGQDIEPETAAFGKDGIDALTVHYSDQGNTVMQTIAFYAVPLTDETCLLVEAGGYEGESTITSDQLSAILDSFALN